METRTQRRIKGWMDLEVTKVHQETHDTITFDFVNQKEKTRSFDYLAGQYLTFRFDHLGPKPLVRSYTMSSSPRQAAFASVTVKRVQGGLVSNHLVDHTKVGTLLRARGPIGKFCLPLRNPTKHLVMLAGGSGITPFVSIIREFHDKLQKAAMPQTMEILASFASSHDLICIDQLQAAAGPHLKLTITLTREKKEGFWHGRVGPDMIDKLVAGDYKDKTFMTCGPQAMMDMLKEHTAARGVPSHNFHMESFA